METPVAELAPPRPPAAAADPGGGTIRSAAAGAIWGVLAVFAHLWGRSLAASGTELLLPTPPLFALLDPRAGPWLLPAVILGAAALVWAPRLAVSMSWRRLLVATLLAGTAWAGALAIADGPRALIAPVLDRHGFLPVADRIHSASSFLRGFTDDLAAYPTHVKSHPPLLPLLLAGARGAGLGSPAVLAALLVVAGASGAVAALIALSEVAGEERARAAAPFLILAPAALWIATSPDALFAAAGAWALALVVVATGKQSPRGDLAALAGGLLGGASLFLSYGLVLLAPVALALGAARRRPRPLLLAALGAAGMVTAFAAAGFWWPEGLAAARREYAQGAAATRPYLYFLVANLAAFALALGPAAAAGLARVVHPRVWLLAGAALVGVVLADLSGLSKGEVERIWLPFAPWVLVATAGLPSRLAARRRWLAAQLLVAVALQALLVTPW